MDGVPIVNSCHGHVLLFVSDCGLNWFGVFEVCVECILVACSPNLIQVPKLLCFSCQVVD